MELNEIEKKLKNEFYIDESSDSLGLLGASTGRAGDRPSLMRARGPTSVRPDKRKAKETDLSAEIASGLVDHKQFKQMEKDLDTELRRLKELGGLNKQAPKDDKARASKRPPNRKLILKKPINPKEDNKPSIPKKQVNSPRQVPAPRQANSSLHHPSKAASTLNPKQAPNSTNNKQPHGSLKTRKATIHNEKMSMNLPRDTLSNLSDLEKQMLNEDADEHFAKINQILNK